ncbi:MAG: glycosyltransferase [Campylobacterota bacterium]|nr:glycosyltransferase [Campylobacterota bacterium]
MNILIFSHVNIYPVDAGSRVRIYNLTNYLKKIGHTIHFVYYTQSGVNKIHFDFMQKMCDTFTAIVKTKKVAQKGENYVLDEWYENSIDKKINELVNLFNIDAVLTNYIFHSKFLDLLPKNIYKIIDTHDRFTDRYKLFSKNKDIKYTWHSYSKEDESKALNRADIVIAITDEENRYFSSISKSKVMTLGHIENKKYLDQKYDSVKKIGFIGGPNQVNIVAINSFLDQFYKTSKNTNNIEIVIAGRICNHIKNKHKNIKLLGLVENLKQFYKDVDLIINPLMFGTGQKIKSIEALSFGLPILSTNIGFEGINSDNELHQLNSIEKMIKSIDKIVEQPLILEELKIHSQNIFDSYIKNIENKIVDIFKTQNTSLTNKEVLKDYRIKTQKELDDIIIQNYQSKIKNQNSKIEKNKSITIKYDTIIKEIREITKISFFKNPIKKYKQYKNILKVYYDKY